MLVGPVTTATRKASFKFMGGNTRITRMLRRLPIEGHAPGKSRLDTVTVSFAVLYPRLGVHGCSTGNFLRYRLAGAVSLMDLRSLGI